MCVTVEDPTNVRFIASESTDKHFSRSVTESQISEYTTIIDGILSNLSASDLETVTSKKVRQGLEAALGGKDLSEQKVRPQAFHFLSLHPLEDQSFPTPLEQPHFASFQSSSNL